MQPDGIGPVRRACVEDSLKRIGQIVTRMCPQDVAAPPVEPGEHENLVARLDPEQCFADLRLEDEPCTRSRSSPTSIPQVEGEW
jgi:NAD-dependent dihydropyrimidine dehydrogenase PreA subunit